MAALPQCYRRANNVSIAVPCFAVVRSAVYELFVQFVRTIACNVEGQNQSMKKYFCASHSAVGVSYHLLVMSVTLSLRLHC